MIRNALISVSNKTNLAPLTNFLYSMGTTIYATGSTHKELDTIAHEAKSLYRVEDLTQHPEFLDGRVKTLHPKVHGGILADRSNPQHMYELKSLEIPPIDLVVCNLYPFEETITSSHTHKEAVENIDIGGPTMIRAAAKNYDSTYVLTSPSQYISFIKTLTETSETSLTNSTHLFLYRKALAATAFSHITHYDTIISNYFNSSTTPTTITKHYQKQLPLKYGLNPQQQSAALYSSPPHTALPFTVLSGSPGYINVLDAIYSWQLVKETSSAINQITVASFKHTSPAGVGTDLIPLSEQECKAAFLPTDSPPLTPTATAFIRARYTDPKSSFGDFLAFSHPVDIQTATLLQKEVSDGVIAPAYEAGVVELLSKKKRGKYLILQADPTFSSTTPEVREMHGVTLVQEQNKTIIKPEQFTPKTAATDNKMITRENQVNLALGMMVLKYTQSNSTCITYRGQTAGVGAGQQSRIDCVKLSCKKAKLWYERQHPLVTNLTFPEGTKRVDKINQIIQYIEKNSHTLGYTPPAFCLASDAFFPFRDNIDVAHKYHVTYVVQPGGSLADKSVIEACDQYKMAMYMTPGQRFFLH